MIDKKFGTREQIVNHIKKYYAKDVKLFYYLMSKTLLANVDFRLVKKAENDDLLSVIEEDVDESIEFPLDSIIGNDSLAIYAKIEELDYSEAKLKKAEQVGLIADVMSDDTLFEGFCLAFNDTDDELEDICQYYGCRDRYLELLQDEVYKKRKKYMRMIAEYTMAATNLYGVIHLNELRYLILEYEKKFDDKGYARKDGNYRNTIIYSPRFFGMMMLQQFIDSMSAVYITLDGFIVHSCFDDVYEEEYEKIINFFNNIEHEITEKDLANFFGTVTDSAFRILYEDASSKDLYIPSKKEFLQYADYEYYEISQAEKRMRRYIEEKHLSNFAAVAKKMEISTAECIDDFMKELHFQASDVGKAGEVRDPYEFIQFVFDSMQGYGIDVEDDPQANEFFSYAMRVMNSVRLWCNHGCTPEEVLYQSSRSPDELTIVPESSDAAKALAEGQEQLEQMGLHIDLEATATNIPMLNFDNSLNGTITKSTKKVYPNDQCPCGSGKKYKKCCGK